MNRAHSLQSYLLLILFLIALPLMRGLLLRSTVYCSSIDKSNGCRHRNYIQSKRWCSLLLNMQRGDAESYPNFSFEIVEQSTTSKARVGLLTTPHGEVQTPNFIFCGTKAAMKALSPDQLRNEGTQIMLSNTYHLMLTPGSELVQRMGGLQKFTGWRGPMLTDSGGYQIFSMGHGSVSSEIKGSRDTEQLGWSQTLLKIDESGATFRSYVDGSIHKLTPELSVQIQRQLGADLIVVLDECTPFNVDKQYTADSMRRSHRWAVRSLEEFRRSSDNKQALYGIVQGGIYEDLRIESAAFINSTDFFGTAIGGCLGSDRQSMHSIVAFTRRLVRDDRPVHLLGIGGVRDIFHGVRQGIDTFDCVHPSRLARHGGALVLAAHWDETPCPQPSVTAMTLAQARREEKLRKKNEMRKKSIAARQGESGHMEEAESTAADATSADAEAQKQSQFLGYYRKKREQERQPKIREHINVSKGMMRNDPRPIDSTCTCYTCRNFSRAYLHHLFKAKESLGGTLVTIHNVHFMNRLMAAIRDGIRNGTLDEVEKQFVHPQLMEELNGTNS